ncbi:MAG: hypothetical protein CVV25_06905 [Ignavibacteriae bacterium HGW-Ignavibacteriae-4]|jgi:cellobiose-specific phosphotransferase system component IIC|nr:MAG: hypothetical protein CVV25_06905 [Ignavibacteriae bacterium HGW-Ignavibacteriae-4]
MVHFFEALIPITMFLMVFGIAFIFLKSRSKERLALIERNIDASLFFGKKKDNLTYWTLRIGSLLFGFGVGLLVGFIMADAYNDDMFIAPPLFIFSGLFWIIEFIVERKIIQKDNK